ncbi:hypothetical protein Taro_002287, partial [Colocasia esculenta]|nr:hypothetical protein [Colocasia esculenta]
PSFQRRTQSGDPNRIPSVPTRHFNPPGRVGENNTPIGSLFGILDPRVVGFSPLYILGYFLDPSFQRRTQSGDPNWIPSIRQLNAQPNPEVQIGFRQFPHVTLTHPIVLEQMARRSDPYLIFWTPGL